MKKICHITTVHQRTDTRIFVKECLSLAKFYDVYLIVADGKGDEVKYGINIFDIGLRQNSRIKRIKIDSDKALQKALELDCDLYHFHDPELVNVGIKLKSFGKKVIYDVHEDLPRQIYNKPYLSSWIKPFLSNLIELQENKKAKKFDYIITATPFIRDRFLKVNKNTLNINNYPKIEEFETATFNWKNKNNQVCYIGGLTEARGIEEIIKALEYTEAKLTLGGTFHSPGFEKKIKSLPYWNRVEFLGFLERNQVKEVLRQSKIGLVTLHPIINYIHALPVKLFEYMSAGIPVIASNITLWKQIIESNKCGLTVDPLKPQEIGEAISSLLNNPILAEQMGRNGRKAIYDKYNWNIEEKKLISIYKSLIT